MKIQLPLLLVAIVLIARSNAAITFHEAVLIRSAVLDFIDLDGDAVSDVSVSFPFDILGPEGPYRITPLGSSSIATASGGIAESFSIGDQLDLSKLSFVDPNGSVSAGGFIYSPLGHYFGEGWGVSSDLDCNPILPPDHLVDLFVVSLNSGVAWVDFIPPANAFDFTRVVRWGFQTSSSPFIIEAVPEPSVMLTTVAITSIGYALKRRRKQISSSTNYKSVHR